MTNMLNHKSVYLFPRKNRSILVTGHRKGPRMTCDDSVFSKRLHEVMDGLGGACPDKTNFRLLTGGSIGADKLALAIAKERQWDSIVIAPCPIKNEVIDESVKHIYVNSKECIDEDIPEDWIRIADENKLHYADVLVVIWDGLPPVGSSSGGGSVRQIREALLRRTPVIWIDSHSGKVFFSDLEKVNETVVARMEASDMDFSWRDSIFGADGFIESSDIVREIKAILEMAWRSDPSSTIKALETWDLWEKNEKRKVAAGIVLRLFSKFFSYKESKPIFPFTRSIGAYRGVDAVELDGGKGESEGYWHLFDRFDRAATHAASRYRDNIISLFLLSSVAVFCAVAGTIGLAGQNAVWGIAEIFALMLIGVILYKDKGKQCHKSWLLLRQTAELFRLNYLLSYQLASLTSMHKNVVSFQKKDEDEKIEVNSMSVERPANWVFQQYVREVGPTQCRHHFSYKLDVDGTKSMSPFKEYLSSQIEYYKNDSSKNQLLNHRVHSATIWLFNVVFSVVILHVLAMGAYFVEHSLHWVPAFWLAAPAHWIHDQQWLLLVTAFLPALAAGLHSIKTTLEFERLQTSSAQQEQKLKDIQTAIEEVEKSQVHEKHLIFRGLVIKAAEIMSEEHEAWAKLIKFQKVGKPA